MKTKSLWAGAVLFVLTAALSLSAAAMDITPQTTMKEIRNDPAIRDSGLYTYTYIWERDCPVLSGIQNDSTLEKVVGKESAASCAAGLNYMAEAYRNGTQITYPLYSQEEIAADPSRAHVELYYCPAEQPGAKFAIVLSGNAVLYSGELRGGISTAWELHRQGYAVFSLRYSLGWEAGKDAPLEDLARAVRFVTGNAEKFDIDTEDYALLGYSSGGHIAGLFGSREVGWGHYGVPEPGVLLLAYPINDFAKVRTLYRLMMDFGSQEKRYYSYQVSDLITPDYPAVFLWFGRNDKTLHDFDFDRQDSAIVKALEEQGVPHRVEVYEDAKHGIGIGLGTDAEGWVDRAADFWKEQTAAKG